SISNIFVDASFAAMSIDLGSQYLKMGVIKQGSPMEIVLNKESRRKTPTLIGMRNGERFFSEPAAQLSLRFPKSVFIHINDVLGKDEGHVLVDEYRKRFPHAPLVAAENGTLFFTDGSTEYSPETLLAMILQNAKAETEAHAGQSVDDVVIAIPPFLTQRERIAIKRAAKIAGLKVLQLLHTGSAAAISWGAFHRKEIDGKTHTMLIYDMGATHITATVAQFYTDDKKETKMKIIGTGYDRSIGGLEMSRRMREHLRERWEKAEKTENPLKDNPRGMAKLMAEAERVKQVLSANTEILSQVEALHEDKNLRLKVTRDELEKLVADMVDRFTPPVDDALKMAGLTIEGLDEVVLMGAATRMPLVQKTLQAHVKRDLGRFLNTDEAIAMGALFQSAHLSKGFKVKPLPIEETVLFPIQAEFSSVDESGSPVARQSALFPFTSVYPSPNPRAISFKSYRDDFEFTVSYGNLEHLNERQRSEFAERELVKVGVSDMKNAVEELKEGDEWKETKVGFTIDKSGIVRVKSAEVVINRPRGAMEALKDSITGMFSKAEEEKGEGESEEEGGEKEKGEGEQVKEEEKKEDKKEEEKKEEEEKATEAKDEKKEVKEEEKKEEEPKKHNSTVIVKDGIARVKLSLSKERLDKANTDENDLKETQKILDGFARAERVKREREAAENELEALAFDTSLLLDEESFTKMATEKERTKIETLVKETRAWLEDEAGVETPTEEFKTKRRALVKAVEVVKKRIQEKKDAPEIMKELKAVIPKAKVIVANVEEKDEDLKGDIKKVIEDVEKWVEKNDKEVADNEDLSYSVLEARLKEDRVREAAKSLKRKIEKRRKEEERKKKKEEEELKKKEEEEKKKNEGEEKKEGEETKEELKRIVSELDDIAIKVSDGRINDEVLYHLRVSDR
ncbi:hypothetical protein PFISCL1PPCAC_8077, partial [Pristionchus fissidentatus]